MIADAECLRILFEILDTLDLKPFVIKVIKLDEAEKSENYRN